jgi:uncharacterized protein with von Willebrand factor type A (vWA) domain
MTNNLDVQIVLDRSGSMANAWDDTLGGLNEYVRQLARDKSVSAKITLSVFDTERIETIRHVAPAKSFDVVTESEAFPRGGTPLFDAVGQGINDMQTRLTDHRKALVVMTDGHENSSREHTQASVKAMIETAQRDDWLVTYLGADHDAWGQAEGLGFAASHVAQYDKKATRETFGAMATNVASYAETGAVLSASFTPEQRARMRGEE